MKFPIRIIIPREKPFDNYTPPSNVKVVYKTGATFDSKVICDYIEEDVKQFLDENGIGDFKATMFFDSAPCHLTAEVAAKFVEVKCKVEKVKKRCTNLHQPFDVCIFAPIKRKLCERWTQWYIKDDKTFTCHSNMRSPG
jgi:hypothetical protein